MRVRENQKFFSLYHETAREITASGDVPEGVLDPWGDGDRTLGQVETPPAMAEVMARWVLSGRPARVLDPAVGPGELLVACRRLDPETELVGMDRDAGTLERARGRAPRGTRLLLADYLRADVGQFDGIIANPPYVKAHRLSWGEGEWRAFEERFGTPLDRLTNLYALFLLKIWEDLAPRGRAAVLLPAEFLNANFGEEIKERIQRELRPAGLAVFAPALNLFPSALTTSALVLLEKSRPAAFPQRVRRVDSFTEAGSFVNELLAGVEVGGHELNGLDPREKWLNRLLHDDEGGVGTLFPKTVGDYFRCRRGIATGANEFFCLSKAGLLENHLTLEHVEPCVTKATDAGGLMFTGKDFDALTRSDRRCYLLNPRREDKALAGYLQRGEKLGIPARHLPSHRPVWFRPENRSVADVWVSVFSRGQTKFILNTSGAKNLTCFHGLYARSGRRHLAPLLTLFLNSRWGAESFRRVNRFYGDGLNKLEPKDVEAMPCPEWPELKHDAADALRDRFVTLAALPESTRRGTIDEIVAAHCSSLGTAT